MTKKTKLETFAGAAEELNEVLGLEPPIETEGASVDELAGKIREASELLYEEDEISDATAAVIADLTEDLDEQEDAAEEGSEENEEEELTLEDLREEVEGLHKRKDMRLLVEEIDLFEPLIEELPDLKSGSALKDAMLKILDEELELVDDEELELVDDEELQPKESPKPKPKKKETTKKKPRTKGPSLTQQCREFIGTKVEEGKYTRKELEDQASQKFSDLSISSIKVIITDSKNPKYNKFDKLVIEDEKGVLSFEK